MQTRLSQGMSYARTFENGSLHPTHLSITTSRPVLITRVLQRGALKETPSRIGKRLGRCSGFTENVHIPSLSESYLSLITSGLLAGSGKSILRYVAFG
jgi:hypothetical protein